MKKKARHRSSRLDGITRIVRIHARIKSKLGIQIHTISRALGVYTLCSQLFVQSSKESKKASTRKRKKVGIEDRIRHRWVVQGSWKGV